jgi:hypothetical protein
MKCTLKIPAERFLGGDIQTGDTLRVVAVDPEFVFEVRREEYPAVTRSAASEWLQSVRGSVKLAPGETLDDVRMDYYGSKHRITPDHAAVSKYP